MHPHSDVYTTPYIHLEYTCKAATADIFPALMHPKDLT